MNKLLEFGRKALFYARVLSGYEERRIRSFRLQLEKRVQQVQERKVAVNKVPEQLILSEVRRMVEEMQALNKKLDETEAAIEEYFKPLDGEAEIIMKMQLEREEKTSHMMMSALEEQAALQAAEAERNASVNQAVNSETDQSEAEILMKMGLGGEDITLNEMMKAMQGQVLHVKDDAENTESVNSIPTSTTPPKAS
ncbi:hypothetical protein TanjilG_06281 [Lupinus angustifolius]|uniref:Uncharacterized protein n=1 Tax=Lupinus angustifolius TaxID=3871 RepID=A0A1J7H0S6_LUPAN|nr:PREDICTED: uncharacterized protein LOC109330354 [Lupinus angustifolius]OIV95412.1 hypothetical protein TanjilG_06281 [Lupinus angustifolius]